MKNVIKRGGHRVDKYGYLGDFWLSQWAANKLDYFSMRRVISRTVRLSLISYSSMSPKKMTANTLHY